MRIISAAEFAERSPSAPKHPRSNCGDPVNCASGNFYETQTDLSVGGRGVGLNLTRTYNSQAGAEGTTGTFGHGWSNSFSDHLVVEEAAATLYHGNGSAVPFTRTKAGAFIGPGWTQDKLTGSSGAGYSLVLANQVKYQFDGSTGKLQSVSDRNGNQTTLGYDKTGRLETITDPAGRKITLAYNGEGLVESAKDPLGHTVKYTYEEGTLASVTLPGEAKARWQYHYDWSHQMTSMTDGRGGKTTNEYDGSHRVISQTDPAEHKLKFEYAAFNTVITNNVTGSVTDEWFNSDGEPTLITRGAGTASATTETMSYDLAGDMTSRTDGNEHTTENTYDGEGNLIKTVDPDKDETSWTYDGAHDVLSKTAPNGEVTTIVRDSHGNVEKISRAGPNKTTQASTFHYDANGELTSLKDPLSHTWSYEYDGQGDRTGIIDPEGDKRTLGYDEDSRETSTVAPIGQLKGVEAAQYTTKIERDAQGRPTTVRDPLGHTSKHVYDGNGNLETFTDGNGRTTTYTYDADNRVTKVKQPNGTVTEAGYDGAGRVTSQTDGNKHTTTYVRNVLGEVIEVKDPLGRVTKKEYDAAGNMIAATDAQGRTTKYAYDPANRLKEVSYSDGKTAADKYEYDADGNRTQMTDGTGKSTFTYDILDRLTQSVNGHGDSVGYEYNLGDNLTKLTYPNGKSVTRVYDKADRLQSITDPSKNLTSFGYNPDSDLVITVYPKAVGAQDKVAFNQADQVMKITMVNGTKAAASLLYARDGDNQIKAVTALGLPGTESTGYGYDANNRLTSAGASTYEYDPADDPTKLGSSTSVYDAANQLKTSGANAYGYDQLGERTSAALKGGGTTTYGWDQAGNLTQVKQSKGGLRDTFFYDGSGLRAAQVKSKATGQIAWDTHGGMPQLLSDEQGSYIYGPNGVPVEEVQSKGAVLYLRYDQQGSIRMATASSGATEATMSYDAYGNLAGSTGSPTSTPFGYAGQYTNADAGLIYMRARAYEPATAQFMSVDPIAPATQTPYTYGQDNPLTFYDPSGLLFGIPGTPSTSSIASAVTGAITSHAGGIVGDIVVGGACAAAPEVCVPAALLAADVSVNSEDVHAALNPSEAGNLPARVLGDLAAAGVGAIPTATISNEIRAAYLSKGGGAWARRQLEALATGAGIGISFLGGGHGGSPGEPGGEGPGGETLEEALEEALAELQEGLIC